MKASSSALENVISTVRSAQPGLVIANLSMILTKTIKFLVIYRIVRGFVILIGLITLLKWIGYDFTHVLNFFAALPEMTNLDETWLGDVYNAIFKQVLDFINGIAENAPPPPDGQKIMNEIKNVVDQSKNM